jgi:hypothetical protein
MAKPAHGYGNGPDKALTVTDLVCGQSLTRKRHQFHPVILARSIERGILGALSAGRNDIEERIHIKEIHPGTETLTSKTPKPREFITIPKILNKLFP